MLDLFNSNIGSQLGLGNADLLTVILRFVRLVLGFAPLAATALLILGGLQWMTSAGNEERLDRAKKTISGAVIGLVIILLAWAIVEFFTRTTLNVSNTTNH
jgi:uncharacterized membrane protein